MYKHKRPLCGDSGCEDLKCQQWCEHDEDDHYICLDCGDEKCPGDDVYPAGHILDIEEV